MTDIPLVSVIFITYKRLDLLTRTYEAFRSICTYPKLEYILCDDGSPRALQKKMRELQFDTYLFAEKNKGLGNNQNKGIVAAKGEYLLQLQDDWLCHGPGDFIQGALEVFAKKPDIGLIRLWNHKGFNIPYDLYQTADGRRVRIYESVYDHLPSERHDYVYSDRPHIKRRSFHEKLGYYREDIFMNDMEIEFCERFEKQTEIKGATIEEYAETFEHIGTEQTFNRSQKRANLRDRLEKHWFLRYPWNAYVALRYGKQNRSD